MKKLCKSNTNKKIAGVCGGVAEYFGIDPTIVRLAFAVLALAYGSAIAFYILGAIFLPEQEEAETEDESAASACD